MIYTAECNGIIKLIKAENAENAKRQAEKIFIDEISNVKNRKLFIVLTNQKNYKEYYFSSLDFKWYYV